MKAYVEIVTLSNDILTASSTCDGPCKNDIRQMAGFFEDE